MTDGEIIDSLGGTAVVARLCEIRPSSVSEWRHNGIPRGRLLYLRTLRPDVFGEPPALGAKGKETNRKRMQGTYPHG